MKRYLLLAALVAVLLPGCVAKKVESSHISFAKGQYTIQLPDGWQRISDNSLELSPSLRQYMFSEKAEFDAIFTGSSAAELPMLFVTHLATARPPLSQIPRHNEAVLSALREKEANPKKKVVLLGSSYHEDKKLLIADMIVTPPNQPEAHCVLALYYTQQGGVFLFGLSQSQEQSSTEAIRAIVSDITFDSNLRY